MRVVPVATTATECSGSSDLPALGYRVHKRLPMDPLTEQLAQAVQRAKQISQRSARLIDESRRITRASASLREEGAMLRADIYVLRIQEQSSAVRIAVDPMAGSPEESSRPTRPIRILIADDNDDTVLTLSALLQDEGYRVRRARDGREAMLELLDFDPDAVVADIRMPEVNGWDFGRAVRRVRDAHRPLLIAMSGHFKRDPDRILAKMTGFNHFLAKPFHPKDLLALIDPLKGGQVRYQVA